MAPPPRYRPTNFLTVPGRQHPLGPELSLFRSDGSLRQPSFLSTSVAAHVAFLCLVLMKFLHNRLSAPSPSFSIGPNTALLPLTLFKEAIPSPDIALPEPWIRSSGDTLSRG
jgi:hypothetical protein